MVDADLVRRCRDVFAYYARPPHHAIALIVLDSDPIPRFDANLPIAKTDLGEINGSEICNVRSLLNRLRGSRPLDRYIWDKLGWADHQLAAEFVVPAEPDLAMAIKQSDLLAERLNQIFRSGFLYECKICDRDVKIPFTRQALELAYPSEFLSSHLPLARPDPSHWTFGFLDAICRFEKDPFSGVHLPSGLTSKGTFVEFLNAAEMQRDLDCAWFGDIWPLNPSWLRRNKRPRFGSVAFQLQTQSRRPLFPNTHRLVVISTEDTSLNQPDVEHWLAQHGQFELRRLEPGNDWFGFIKALMQAIRNTRSHSGMFVRAKMVSTLTDFEDATGWW